MRLLMTAASSVAIGAAIVVTATVPAFGVGYPGWFIAGVIITIGAVALSLAINFRASLSRFDGVVAALGFIALGLLRIGSDPHNPLFVYLAVLPVLVLAGDARRRYLVFTILGCFIALFVPIVIAGVLGSIVDLFGVIFATIVITVVAVTLHEATTARRAAQTRVTATELERSGADQSLRGLWEAVTEQAIIGTDLSGRIEAWNPGAERMLGVSAADAELTLNVVDFHVRQELDACSKRVMFRQDESKLDLGFVSLVGSAAEGTPSRGEWTYLRGDGSQLSAQVTVTARRDASGLIVGYLFVAMDLTENRKLITLQDASISLISHELRTPLSSILGYIELMREEDDEPLSGTQLSYLRVAERNANRLLELIADLVFTAKVSSGTEKMNVEKLDLAPILETSLESARPIAATSGITLSFDSAAGVIVDGNPVRLGQAIDHLVLTALKFTPRGGTVAVSLVTNAAEAVLSVGSTGLTTSGPTVPGGGLELTITQAIVTAHHGVMSVEGVEGAGALSTVRLPLAGLPAVSASRA